MIREDCGPAAWHASLVRSNRRQERPQDMALANTRRTRIGRFYCPRSKGAIYSIAGAWPLRTSVPNKGPGCWSLTIFFTFFSLFPTPASASASASATATALPCPALPCHAMPPSATVAARQRRPRAPRAHATPFRLAAAAVASSSSRQLGSWAGGQACALDGGPTKSALLICVRQDARV